MKFVIWQAAYLGDVVLATPLVTTLRENFPNADITFAGRPFVRDLFKGSYVKVLTFSKGLFESFRVAKILKGFDVAIVPHRSLRTALIMLASRIPMRIGFNRSEFKYAYTHVVEHRWDLHEVYRNLKLLEPLRVKKIKDRLWLPMEEEEKEAILRKFNLKEGSYVVVNPFSNFPLKEWSLSNWKNFIKLIERKITPVVTGTDRDIEKVKELNLSKRVINLVGRTSLRELMGVIKGSRLVVSNDSSPVHIANAFGVPAITIYTATSPEYGFYPLIGTYIRNPAPCSPCSPNPKRCKMGTKECVNLISPDLVFETAKQFL